MVEGFGISFFGGFAVGIQSRPNTTLPVKGG